jgi:hypothetical protein
MQSNKLSGPLRVHLDDVGAYPWSITLDGKRYTGILENRTQFAEFMQALHVTSYNVPTHDKELHLDLTSVDPAVLKDWADAD